MVEVKYTSYLLPLRISAVNMDIIKKLFFYLEIFFTSIYKFKFNTDFSPPTFLFFSSFHDIERVPFSAFKGCTVERVRTDVYYQGEICSSNVGRKGETDVLLQGLSIGRRALC